MNNQSETKIKQIGDYTFDFNKKIGSGYSSKVYLGENLQNKQIVAIKVISSQTYISPIQKSLLKNEISILLRIDHPHLLKVFEVSQSANNTYIVTEYCNGGNLEQEIKKTQFPLPKVLSILKQISLGIQALHDKKIIHRDIKPANILIHDNVYKLADFGFALIEDQIESIIKRFNVGTPLYMAPEILRNNQYSEKSDIWALGIMSYELIFNCIPPFKSDIKLFHDDIQKKCQKIDPQYQVIVQQLLFGMLQVETENRENINQILNYLSYEKSQQSENLSPRITKPFIKLPYKSVQSNLSSPLSTPKYQQQTIQTQRLKYHKKVQSLSKPQTFNSINFLPLNTFQDVQNKVNSVSDFNNTIEDNSKQLSHTSAKNKIHKNNEQTGQFSTECSFSALNNNNNNKQNSFSFKMQQTQLPAIVLPTYNFCLFLENIIKNMDCQTEQKQKCNFLFRKLLAIKAKAFYSFAPKTIKESLGLWIEQLNTYYEKVQHTLNFTFDNTFQIFFNSLLEDQGKLLSMYLVSLMSQIILKEQNQDFEVLIEILQENVKHQNDPFLFARKWAHNQLS